MRTRKLSVLFVALSIPCIHLSAQTYPCETSRIGQLVVKPLVRNETIHYNEIVTSSKDKRAGTEDFTSMNKDSVGNIYIARHRMIDKDRSLDLLFVSKKSGACIYQITLLAKGSTPHGIRLDEDGGATDWDENTPLNYDVRKEEQKLVDQWILYFK